MSSPYEPPRPAPTRPDRPSVPRPTAAPEPLPRWGWIELFVAAQTFIPALFFVPGITVVRTLIRGSAYLLGFVAWFGVARRPGAARRADTFPARPWLIFCAVWLVVSVAHPNTYSLKTAVMQVVFYLSVMSPAFWVGPALETPRQFGRVVAVLFLCNAASATVGLGQALYPTRFNPPVVAMMDDPLLSQIVSYKRADGVTIVRPCGLTDTPGAGAHAGAAAAMFGLCFALRPIAGWKRLGAAALAFVGVAVIYYTQVRFTMVMFAVCIAVLTGLFTLQGNVGRALTLVAAGAGTIVGALLWVSRSVGTKAFERFSTLLTTDPGNLYQKNRGMYVTEALFTVLPEHPLGYGLGWWGMVHALFGDPDRVTNVWVEVMIPAWAYDGGFPLLAGYAGAIAVALYDSARVALRSPSRDLRFWGAVVVAQNLSIVATCFSYVTFVTPLGLQFWVLSAGLHAADRLARRQDPSRPDPGGRGPRGAFAG